MLCYESSELEHMVPGDVFFENIQGSEDLLAKLLLNSLDIWNRYSPMQEYTKTSICSDRVVGEVDIFKSIVSGALASGKIYCNVYKLDIDNPANQMIKLAISIILKYTDHVNDATYGRLKSYMLEFDGVSTLDIFDYSAIRNDIEDLPSYYKPVIAASKIVIENILASDKQEGSERSHLYVLEDHTRYQFIFEGFVKNFYKTEYAHGGIKYTRHKWITRNDKGERNGWSIPDVVMHNADKALIIDTKWYARREFRDRDKGNQYQMRAYMEEYLKEFPTTNKMTGVILYADTGEIKKDSFNMDGFSYKYYRRAINLNQDFDQIKKDLIALADEYLK